MRNRPDRPQEIRTKRVYGNLRHTAFDPPLTAEREPASLTGRDEAYRAVIRSVGCLFCPEAEHVHFHHLKSGPAAKERCMGKKASDRWGTGLCFFCHNDLERHPSWKEPLIYADKGYPIVFLCTRSWGIWIETHSADRVRSFWLVHRLSASATTAIERKPP